MTNPAAEEREEAAEPMLPARSGAVHSSGWGLAGTLLGLLGALVLVLVVAREWRHTAVPIDFSEFRVAILEAAGGGVASMEVLESDPVRLDEALVERGAPSVGVLPEGLRQLKPEGGRVVEWEGRPVSVVEYLAGSRRVLLFVIKDVGFVGAPAATVPAVALSGDWATATWRDGGCVCMLATRGLAADLRVFL